MSKTLCMAAFNSLYYDSGTVKMCAKQNTNEVVLGTTLEQAFNSDQMKEARLRMRDGIQVRGCDVCYETEAAGATSFRHYLNTINHHSVYALRRMQPDGTLEPRINHMHHRWSNLCNLKCRTCNVKDSSSWANDHKAMTGEEVGYKPSRVVVNEIYNFYKASDVRTIQIGGGEPLLEPMQFDLFRRYAHSDVDFIINTNLTSLTEETLSLWANAKACRVHVIVSVDGIGAQGEYIRTGLKWKQFEKNVRLLYEEVQRHMNLTLSFNTVASIYNFLDLHEIYSWLIQFPARNSGARPPWGSGHNAHVYALRDPYYLRPGLLGPKILNARKIPNEEWRKVQDQVQSSFPMEIERVLLVATFKEWNDKLDALRGQSIRACPRTWDALWPSE